MAAAAAVELSCIWFYYAGEHGHGPGMRFGTFALYIY